MAVIPGKPSFQELIDVYLENVVVEKIILAEEIKTVNPAQLETLLAKLGKEVQIEFVSHDELKQLNRSVKAIIRTGENTPYSNVILQSGVTI